MSDIKDRLTQFAISQGFKSFGSFEIHCGFNRNTLAKSHSGVSSASLEKVGEKFPHLNLNWLILGRGQMIEEESPQPAPAIEVKNIETVNIGNWDVLGEIVHKAIASALRNQ